MWLHRVFTDLANTNKRNCLTIDCSGVNKNGPGRYRTQADNLDKQVCYFNKTRNDEFYNVFISERINSESFDKGIYFQITRVRDKNETFDAEKLWKKMAQQMIDFQKLTSTQVLENEELNNFLNQIHQELVVPDSQPDPNFFQDYNDVLPKKLKYSSTKVKTRNLSTNLSYRQYNLKNETRSFYIDLFSYIL